MIPTISRRSWIGLSSAALLGCEERKSPAAAAQKPAPASVEQKLQAGPFSVDVPSAWKDSARIEKVPARPLYTPEEWKNVQAQEREGAVPAVSKPDYGIRPQHWAVRLPAALPPGFPDPAMDAGDNPTAPQILIHKAAEWSSILQDGLDGRDKSTTFVRSLRDRLDAEIAGQTTDCAPAFMDAHLGFRALKRRLDFDGGHGIRMLAQWMIEPDFMRKGRLHYLFLGMSDDDSCQIIATFPASLPGLPGEDSEEHLGRSFKRYEEFSQNADSYERDAVAWLEQHAAEVTPSLDTLDKMLESLVVRRWE